MDAELIRKGMMPHLDSMELASLFNAYKGGCMCFDTFKYMM